MRPVGFVCAIALVVGCSGSTFVRPFGGEYDLITVDGEPDPQPLAPGTTTADLVGGMLSVGADTLDVTLLEQPVDGSGRATGEVTAVPSEIAYVRHGDSLFFSSDTVALNDSLFLGGPPKPFGAILGSDVRLTLDVPKPSSTGFANVLRRFLFAPAQ